MVYLLENQLLAAALDAFERETGLKIDRVELPAGEYQQQVDGVVELPCKAGRVAVEVKKWAQHTNVGAIANRIRSMPMEGLLVADYINPKMADKLREMEIHFIDAVGNAYINKPPLFVWTTGNKPATAKAGTKDGINRAFDATGLKVIFGFLCNAELVNAPYREIAEQTNVALGTIGWVINGLIAAGYCIDEGKKKGRRIINHQKLLDRWVEAYPEKLKPKLKVGEFITDNPNWWQKNTIRKYHAYWGGEVAAAKYTDFLKPKVVTIYQAENADKQLFAEAKLRKANHPLPDDNLVKIYKMFWTEKLINPITTNNKKFNELVHPILTYADLIATGDIRNLEVAKEIYERYIAETIRKD